MTQVILGRKLYYHKITGNVIFDTGERMGENIIDTTIEEDFKYALELRDYSPEIIGCIQLEPAQYSDEFAEAVSYRVNPETKELEFGFERNSAYNFQPTYKVQIEELNRENEKYRERIADLELLLSDILSGGGME